jgi:hypothetical protein
MIGLILDNIIVFLWRTIAHWRRSFRCESWPSVVGTVDNIDCPEHEMYPFTEIHYCYKVGDEDYDARCLRGFWEDKSAQFLANRYAKVKSVKVRYSPTDHAKSYILDKDQESSSQ